MLLLQAVLTLRWAGQPATLPEGTGCHDIQPDDPGSRHYHHQGFCGYGLTGGWPFASLQATCSSMAVSGRRPPPSACPGLPMLSSTTPERVQQPNRELLPLSVPGACLVQMAARPRQRCSCRAAAWA